MNLLEAPARRVNYVRASVLLVAAVAIPILFALVEADLSWMLVGFVLSGICGIIGLLLIQRARRTSAEEMTVHSSVALVNLPPAEKVKHLRRLMWISLVLFPILTAETAYELYGIETLAEKDAFVWWPVAFVYEQFGFWPAVMVWPMLAIGTIIMFVIAVRRTKERLR